MHLTQNPRPNSDQVVTWKIDIQSLTANYIDFFALLSTDEKARAKRFHFNKDSQAFTITRAALRLILCEHMSIRPDLLQFSYTSYGKPYLSAEQYIEPVQFNVSHSAQVGHIAITKSAEVGIDVECCTPDRKIDYMELAKRFFSLKEYNLLAGTPKAGRQVSFYRYWTCKEAYIKALGKGLSVPLNTFEINLHSNRAPTIINNQPTSHNSHDWRLFEIPTTQGYLAALATHKSICDVQAFDFHKSWSRKDKQ